MIPDLHLRAFAPTISDCNPFSRALTVMRPSCKIATDGV